MTRLGPPQVRKGNSIREFLQKCLDVLRKEFPELRTIGVDSLLYIKEDLIIPHVCSTNMHTGHAQF
jgi:hypothetical protein